MEVSNHLSALRTSRGLSAVQLADMVQVSRQTVYAIEAGRYMPNTALALKLARVLNVSVEALFSLTSDVEAPQPEPVRVDLISAGKTGQPVRLCRVGENTVAVPVNASPAFLPLADGVLSGKASVLPFVDGQDWGRILIAGCDPALSLLAEHARTEQVDVVLANCNSSRALDYLKAGRVHVAGTHLGDDYSAVKKRFAPGTVRIVTFAAWAQGLVVRAGNPKGIRSVADLCQPGLMMANREPGSGSRILFDAELKRCGISSEAVGGYDSVVWSHLAAAGQVAAGFADCCIASEAAARAFGLHFIGLNDERFDFVMANEFASTTNGSRLLEGLQRLRLRRELMAIGGYDTAQTGSAVDF